MKRHRLKTMATFLARQRMIVTKRPEVSLTARQMDILRLILQGLTNQQIAEAIDLSRRTVEVHRYRLMQRLEVRNVAQLFRRVFELRLFSKTTLTKRILSP